MAEPIPEGQRWLQSLDSGESVKLSKENIRMAEDGTPLVVNENGEVRGWLLPPYPSELVDGAASGRHDS